MPMNEKKTNLTIYDISEKTGVSIATVSRVINGSDNVSSKTRDKIMSAIEESGYKPNAFARGLGLNSMKTIGILCADSSDAYLAKAVYYIEEELRANQYDSLLLCTGYDFKEKKKAADLLLTKKVDAAILIGSNFYSDKPEENDYIRTTADQIPVMLLNASFDYKNVYSLYCDDYSAVKNAAEGLLKSGRKNFLYLYNSVSYSGIKKLSGYRDAFEGTLSDVARHVEGFLEGGPECMEAFLEKINEIYSENGGFDACIASEDYLAIAMLKYASRNKISVPEALSIVGYNNSSLALLCEPELSSIDNRLEVISKQLVKTLLGVLNREEMPKKTEYSAELILRGTTNI